MHRISADLHGTQIKKSDADEVDLIGFRTSYDNYSESASINYLMLDAPDNALLQQLKLSFCLIQTQNLN